MPKSVQPKAKAALHEIWMASTKQDAEKALEAFLEKYHPKYDAACDILRKDRDVLLTYYDFPAEHWKHLSEYIVFCIGSGTSHNRGRRFRRPLPSSVPYPAPERQPVQNVPSAAAAREFRAAPDCSPACQTNRRWLTAG